MSMQFVSTHFTNPFGRSSVEVLLTGYVVGFPIKVHLISQQGFFSRESKKTSKTSEQREKRIEEIFFCKIAY